MDCIDKTSGEKQEKKDDRLQNADDDLNISIDEFNQAIEAEKARLPKTKPGRPAKSESPPAEPKRKKPKPLEIYQVLNHVANKGASPLPPFPARFHVIKDFEGHHAYLEELDGQVLRYVSTRKITDAFGRFSNECGVDDFALTAELAEKCANYWAMRKDPIADDDIKPVRELSEPGYTYHRLPFDFTEGEFPYLQEIMDRTTNSRALMAWIGSLFDPKSDMQQYVWWYGDGGNGKGVVARALAKILGRAFAGEHVPTSENRFWTAGLVGKRLVLFGDCNNYGFPVSGIFKSLTGGDHMRVERKNKEPYSTPLIAKFMFLSNEEPTLTGSNSDLRRVIYCTTLPKTQDFGPDYEEVLIWNEVPHFIHHCCKLYAELTEGQRIIPCDTTLVQNLVDMNEEDFDVFVHHYLNVGKNIPKENFCTASDMQSNLKSYFGRDSHIHRKVRKFMERKYGIKSEPIRIAGIEGKVRVYLNCSSKPPGERTPIIY